MKLRSIITVLATGVAALVLTGCEQQPPAPPSSGETRPEATATNTAAPSKAEQPPPVPLSGQPAPSMGGENQPPPQETNQPPNSGPVE
jgi:PBP1b-binding outer membrane lipoprotein LpoB